jgi:chemosensory pili system protein ChpE
MYSLFLSSLVLGVAFCAPPGVVTAESLRCGLHGGFRPVMLVQAGSLVGDATWAAIALFGAAFLVQNPLVRLVLGVLGVFFLFRLAFDALYSAWAGRMPESMASGQGYFTRGALLSLTNPFAIAFWLGVGGAMAASGVDQPRAEHFLVFFTGFMIGAVLWAVSISSLIAWGRRFVHPGLFRWINLLSGLTLGCFGLQLLFGIIQSGS